MVPDAELVCEIGAGVCGLKACGSAAFIFGEDRYTLLPSVDGPLAPDHKTPTAALVDALALTAADNKCLSLLALEDGSLVGSSSSTLKLDARPLHLLPFREHGAVVCCVNGDVLVIEDARLTLPNISTTSPSPLSAVCLGCSCSSITVSLLLRVKGRVELRQWNLSNGTSRWLASDQATISHVAIIDKKEVILFMLQGEGNSVFVIKGDEHRQQVSACKLDAEGHVLMQCPLAQAPLAATMVSAGLALLFAGELQVLDTRYGSTLLSKLLPDKLITVGAPVCLMRLLNNGDELIRILTTRSGKSKVCILMKTTVALPVGGGSLRNALSSRLLAEVATEILPGDENVKVLAGMSGPLKRKLVQAQTSLYAFIAAEDRHGDGQEEADATSPSTQLYNYNKLPRFYIDISADASVTFLTRFASSPVTALLASDWSMLKVLVRSCTVSLATYPDLIDKALSTGRADVLAYLLQYSPDLSERQAVFILCEAVGISDEALGSLVYSHGELHWHRDEARVKGKGKSKGKASEGRGDGEADTLDSVDWSRFGSHLELLRALLEAALRRTAAFSRALLADSLARLASASATLILRVVSLMLRGLTTPCLDPHLGPFNDILAGRAADWAEALLDAHCSSMALHLSVADRRTHDAVAAAVAVSGGLGEATERVERLLGLCTHAARISAFDSAMVVEPFQLYSVEKLAF